MTIPHSVAGGASRWTPGPFASEIGSFRASAGFSVTVRLDPEDRRGRLGVGGGLAVAGVGAAAAPVGLG
jgi:hypothetical protein